MPAPGTQVGSTTASHAASGNLTATLPQAATAGDLLLIVVAGHSGSSSLTPSITTPAGWSRVGGTATTSTTSDKTIHGNYYKVAAGGETSVTFTLTNCGSGSSSVATEWAGPIAAPLDQNGTAATSGASSTGRTDTSTAIIDVGPLDLNFGVHVGLSVAATGTPTSSWGTGLTGLYVDPWTNQLSIDLAVSTSTGATTVTPSDTWTANGAVLGTIMKSFSFFLTPTGTGSLTLAATGSAAGAGSATEGLSLGASAATAARASATGSLNLGASAAAAAAAPAATSTLNLSGSATVNAQGVGGASLFLDSTADARAAENSSASITLTTSGDAAGTGSGVTASVTLGATATSAGGGPSAATLSVAASGSADGVGQAAAGAVTLSGSGTPAAPESGGASLSLDATAAANAAVMSSAPITLTSTAAAAGAAGATASVTLTGVSTGRASSTASAALSLGATATRPIVTIHGTAVAAWGELTIDAAGTDYKEGVVSIDWGALTIIADNSPHDHDGILVCVWGE